MRGLLRALGAGLLFAALSGAGASAQTGQDAATQAHTYLETGMARHVERGYGRDRTIGDVVTPLRLDSAFLWPVTLRAGVNYRVYAACDNDCQDVDMELYGADGMLADRDIAVDDTPYVQITPTASGRHYVRFWVYACNSEPCFVAARVVSGGRPEEREEEGAGEEVSNDWETVVRTELTTVGARHERGGYAQFGEDLITPLVLDNVGHREVIHLEANRSYIFQGACDQDCGDVDMEILDGRGDQIDVDIAADDRPVVEVRPTRAGDYTVRIWLADCRVEPCYVGLRSYARAR